MTTYAKANTTDLVRTLLSAGHVFSGGSRREAIEIAANWASQPLAHSVSDWIAVGVWSPDAAWSLEQDGLLPEKVAKIGEHWDSTDREFVGGSAIYAICNGDLSIEEFRYERRYRVMDYPEGSSPIYCGEFDNETEAHEYAEADPCGTPESEWGSMRAAGNGQAPDPNGVTPEDYEPGTWYGESGFVCVEPVLYDLAS